MFRTITVSLGMKYPLYVKSSVFMWGVPSQKGLWHRSISCAQSSANHALTSEGREHLTLTMA